MLAGTLVAAAVFALVVSRLPHALLRRYASSFRARHGVGMQISLVVLCTVTGSAILATVFHPGHELMELVNGGVVGALIVAALLDLWRFSRR